MAIQKLTPDTKIELDPDDCVDKMKTHEGSKQDNEIACTSWSNSITG